MKTITTQRPVNTMNRMKRPDLPSSQSVYMGPPVGQTATAASVSSSDREQALEKQVADLKAKLSKQSTAVDPKVAALTEEAEALKKMLGTARSEVDSLKAELKKTEENLASTLEDLNLVDSKPLPDKVWVTAIDGRVNDNGNAVVTCTMHFGETDSMVTGTIYIPTSEIGKLKPPRNPDAGQ